MKTFNLFRRKQLKRYHYASSFDRKTKWMFVMWLLGVIISFSFYGAIIWVAWHFISKYW
jgi:hypothetical protein